MKTGLVILVCFSLIFCFCACSVEGNVEENETAPSELQYLTLSVYRLSRLLFEEFLETPSHELLTERGTIQVVSSQNDEFYLTTSFVNFHIQKEFVSFVTDVSKLQNYLNDSGVSGMIQQVLLYDAPNIPLTIWVQTNIDNIYITVNEEYFDELYTYRIYSEEKYYEKYVCVEGALYINDRCALLTRPLKIYHNNVDIPFLSVIQELGGIVEPQDNNTFLININKQYFILDIQALALYSKEDASCNMLNEVDGGPVFAYILDNELMLDWSTMQVVLEHLGENVKFHLDRSTATLSMYVEKTQGC